MPKKKRGYTGGVTPIMTNMLVEIRSHHGEEKSVTICACQEILVYTHEEIKVRVGKGVVQITGEDLCCHTYGNRVAELMGRVCTVTFLEDKR